MEILKLKADKIFNGYELIYGKVLMLENGVVIDLVADSEAGEDIRLMKGILSPGLVNAHCHLELSHMKGHIPEKTGLVDFVFKVVTERHHPEEEIKDFISMAEEEMITNGIVAVGDICNNMLTLSQKQKSRISYYNFIEASGWIPSVAQSRFERALSLFNDFSEGLTGKAANRNSIVPHAPYSVSEGLWQQIKPFFENRVVCIHNQETSFEDEFFMEGEGDLKRMYEMMKIDNTHHKPTKRSSLQSYFDKLKAAASVILVHNTFTRQEDIDHVKENGHPSTHFCICINANQYIEQALPPIEMLQKNHCSLVLGTDSLASNHSLDIMGEIRTISKYFPSISLDEKLKWATINGARALQMQDELGSFEKGKKPGVILINEKDLKAERII